MGSCGTAVARGRPVYADDLDTDPNWKDFRELALGHGLRAFWSTPIRAADGRILGTFAVYYDQPRSPTHTDIEAIAFFTQTAALAIERLTSEHNIRRGQDDLKKLNETLEQQVQERTEERDRAWRLSQELLVVTLPDGTLEAVNASCTRILGWDAAEIIGTKFEQLTHPDDLQATLTVFADIFDRPLKAGLLPPSPLDNRVNRCLLTLKTDGATSASPRMRDAGGALNFGRWPIFVENDAKVLRVSDWRSYSILADAAGLRIPELSALKEGPAEAGPSIHRYSSRSLRTWSAS